MKKVFGLLLVGIGLAVLGFVVYRNSRYQETTQTFSSYSMLRSSWEHYKVAFMNDDGRVIDYSQGSITTSEGQSYALLRAVWLDDKETFDRVLQWTKDNLQLDDAALFGWRWGELENGQFGFLQDGGSNSATDADSDIALALLFAGKRWNDGRYTEEAQRILQDIWEQETEVVGGKRYLLPGSWARYPDKVVLNPSYFAPYAWRIFATADTVRDWNSLIDPAYEILEASQVSFLDKTQTSGLPPDWVALRRENSVLEAPGIENLTTNYSFDAMRVPFRISLDYQWHQEPRAKQYVEQAFAFLKTEYETKKTLSTSYDHAGSVVIVGENPTMYATALAYFALTDRSLAESVYVDKVLRLYANDKDSFRTDIPYYEQNWLWFGSAFYNGFLVNIFQ